MQQATLAPLFTMLISHLTGGLIDKATISAYLH